MRERREERRGREGENERGSGLRRTEPGGWLCARREGEGKKKKREEKKKREGEERTCDREEEKEEKREEKWDMCVRRREIRVVQKREEKGREKEREREEREEVGHLSHCEWMGIDRVIFS